MYTQLENANKKAITAWKQNKKKEAEVGGLLMIISLIRFSYLFLNSISQTAKPNPFLFPILHLTIKPVVAPDYAEKAMREEREKRKKEEREQAEREAKKAELLSWKVGVEYYG